MFFNVYDKNSKIVRTIEAVDIDDAVDYFCSDPDNSEVYCISNHVAVVDDFRIVEDELNGSK